MDAAQGEDAWKVEDRGDYLHCTVLDGPVEGVQAMLDRILALEEERRRRGDVARLRVLYDIQNLRNLPAGVSGLVVRRKAEFRNRVMAVVGAPGPGGSIVSVLSAATGNRASRYFTSTHEALAWLLAQ